ncbi:MAG: T9SS type A sorting domain-containing protein [Bacteroidales bacterium]|nr:T9SS type A sorting domain-containing protein [Bacteroidales bacterium]
MNKSFISLKKQFLILLVLVFIGTINSQEWENISPPGGEIYLCLHLDSVNDILYTGTAEGFWYYNLQTNVWTDRLDVDFSGRAVYSINSNPDVPGRIITGRVNEWFNGYLEISNDWGVTNNVLFYSYGGYISDIKYSPSNTSIFYACGGSNVIPGDLLKSSDGGETWSQLSNYAHTFMFSMAVSPTSSNVLYLSGEALITKTNDGGLTWILASNGLPSSLRVYNVAMNQNDENTLICTNDNGLYRTINGGENWEWIYGERCKRIVYNPVYPNTVAVITFNTSQILLSTNNGADWIDFSVSLEAGDFLRDIEFSGDGTALYAATNNHIYFSEIVISGIDNEKIMDNNSILSQNIPNPFTQSTHIEFYLEEKQEVKLVIYDIAGKEICTLKSESMPAGKQSVIWDGKNSYGADVEKGIYFYSIQLGARVGAVRKMLKN